MGTDLVKKQPGSKLWILKEQITLFVHVSAARFEENLRQEEQMVGTVARYYPLYFFLRTAQLIGDRLSYRKLQTI